MFNLTPEIKNNLLRDLSSECHCFFQDDVLCCYYGSDSQNPPIEIDFSNITNDVPYSQLLSELKSYLLRISNLMSGACNYLCNLSVLDFIDTLSLNKSDMPIGYYPVAFNILGTNYYLSSEVVYGDEFGTHEIDIIVTKELLEVHNISVDAMHNIILTSFMDI